MIKLKVEKGNIAAVKFDEHNAAGYTKLTSEEFLSMYKKTIGGADFLKNQCSTRQFDRYPVLENGRRNYRCYLLINSF